MTHTGETRRQDPGCRACDAVEGCRRVSVREMMFGTRDVFEYLDCAQCGSLSIVAPPPNLADYYPAEYYSLQPPRDSAVKSWLKGRWIRHGLGHRSALGWLLSLAKGPPWLPEPFTAPGLERHHSIIDIGSGSGHMLLQLRDGGFSDLTGLDPHVPRDLHFRGGVSVLKQELSEHSGSYDFAMLNHSFEHMEHPRAVMTELHRLLRPGGRALIRTPVAQCRAWQTFGTDWVQLDAPRHLFIPSMRGMELLAEAGGFELDETRFDSTALQFWGSVQYQNGIALRGPRSYAEDPRRSMFSRRQIESFDAEARRLNEERAGDQACFYLRRP